LLNLTFASRIETNYSLKEIFFSTQAKYKLWLRDAFVCFSPEIFVKIENGEIRSFPMKGTIDASVPQAERKLLNNRKETAEHATIVDLIRNDLSRVARQVEVKRFRYIDHLKTHKNEILQVSSEISGMLPETYFSELGDIIFALLPAGSVSGAPKDKTLEIIRAAEGAERGYYTGIAGIFDGTNLDSAVLIRFIEKTRDGTFYRSGGGITGQSNAEDEYHELIQKIYVPLA
jgi:para-aminobenzoate synthetase component 1